MVRTKIAFLYSELAGYFLACAEELSKSADVLIIHWPVNEEAPFQFRTDSALKLISKNGRSVAELKNILNEFNPDSIVCSGWMDKDYLKVVKSLPKKINRILSLDNHWTGSWRQYAGVISSPFFLKRLFTHAWVPGPQQMKFAQKLGFGKKILTGFYCADTPFFASKYHAFKLEKENDFPKRFIFVGRYVKHKGIFELWEAFASLQVESPNEWELWCLGTGDEWENRFIHPKIRHIGFVQPSDMETYLKETGVYILPSTFEPWGVSVHEMAAAGFPLLLSDKIGSAVAFLKDNGALFKAGDTIDLKHKLTKIMNYSTAELNLMGQKSHSLGMSYTPADWAKKIQAINE